MTVSIRYKVHGDDEEKRRELTRDAFFDGGDVPRFGHAHEYLDVDVQDLAWTVLHVEDSHQSYSVRTQFMQGGEGWMTHRADDEGGEEIIVTNDLPDGSSHIVKIHKSHQGQWKTITNVLIDAEETVLDLRSG